MLAVACAEKKNGQNQFCELVEQSLTMDVSGDKVVATLDPSVNRTYSCLFLFNDDREDVVEIWHRYSREFSYLKGETVGWVIGFAEGGKETYAYPVKAPRFGIIEREEYSLVSSEYNCVEPSLVDNSGILFVMRTDSIAICNEYMNARRARMTLEELERNRALNKVYVQMNKFARKSTDW